MIDVRGEKGFARGAGDGEERLHCGLLGLIARGLSRQSPEERRRLAPERGKPLDVELIGTRLGREGARPFGHRLLRQAGRAHEH